MTILSEDYNERSRRVRELREADEETAADGVVRKHIKRVQHSAELDQYLEELRKKEVHRADTD